MSENNRLVDRLWQKVFDAYDIGGHNFAKSPFVIKAQEIRKVRLGMPESAAPRILCRQITRESRPRVFQDNGLFILPVRNGEYAIIKGEGYVDIPPIKTAVKNYSSKLKFALDTSAVGDSEMQHLDYAYAVSMVRDFTGDDSLVMTIRGRKYTPKFSFTAGGFNITAESVQTEVDSGYEGRERVVLMEAKNSDTANTIIRQLYYPYRQWAAHTKKKISTVFFEKKASGEYHFWEFVFGKKTDYNSIRLLKSARYKIAGG